MNPIFNFAIQNVFTGAIVIFFIIFIGISLSAFIGYKKAKIHVATGFKNDVSTQQFIISIAVVALISFIISATLFAISTSFVEYPGAGVIYKKDSRGLWIKQNGRVFHSFLNGDEETFTVYGELKNMKVSLSENSPFIVKYHIDDSQISAILSHIKIPSGCGCNGTGTLEQNVGQLIKDKSYKFFILHKIESMVDDSVRLKLFQDYYSPYGINIDSVDFP